MKELHFSKPLPFYIHDSDYSVYENMKIYDFPSDEFKNLIYASESYGVRSRKRDLKRNFTTVCEALIKTYPVRKFIDDLLRTITLVLNQEKIYVAVTDNGKIMKEEYVYTNPYSKNENESYEKGLNFRIAIATLNLENEIAGNVMFIIEGMNDEHSLSNVTLKRKIEDKLDDLSRAGRRCGYNYVTSSIYDNQFIVQYESKYKSEDINCPRFLYHITTKSKIDKILRIGLVPKSDSISSKHGKLNHPDRIYLFTRKDCNKFKSLIDDFAKKSEIYDYKLKECKQTDDFVVLKIDTDKIHDFHLFCDNTYPNKNINEPDAVYTYNNIPPYAISVDMELRK